MLTALLGMGSVATAQTTGKTALALVAKARGVPAGAILEVSGVNGQDQPPVWRVITRDPEFTGRFREYHVSQGKITAVGPLSDDAAPVVNRAGLVPTSVKIDSPQVFHTANEAAKTALVGFDSIDYLLRNKEYSSDPIWVVRLKDYRGQQVGEIVISAQTGHMLQRTWFQNGRAYANTSSEAPPKKTGTTAPSQPQGKVARAGGTANRQAEGAATPGKTYSTGQEFLESARAGLNQSREALKTGYQRASSVIGGWINKVRQSSESAADRDSGTYDSARP